MSRVRIAIGISVCISNGFLSYPVKNEEINAKVGSRSVGAYCFLPAPRQLRAEHEIQSPASINTSLARKRKRIIDSDSDVVSDVLVSRTTSFLTEIKRRRKLYQTPLIVLKQKSMACMSLTHNLHFSERVTC